VERTRDSLGDVQLPWRTAPLAALSSLWSAFVAAVAGLLLAFVAATAVLYVDTVGTAATGYQTGQSCAQDIPPTLDGPVVAGQADQVASIARQTAAQYGFGQVLFAEYTSPLRLDINGTDNVVRLGYRDGAVDHLSPSQGGARDGIWIPRSAAVDSHAVLGQHAEGVLPAPGYPSTGLTGGEGGLPPITAVYPNQDDPLPDWWCAQQSSVVVPALSGDNAAGPVVWLPNPADLSPYRQFYRQVSIRFPSPVPVTTADGAALVARGTAMVADLRGRLDAAGLNTVTVNEPWATEQAIAERARANVRYSVLPLTLVSLVVGLAGAGAVAVGWTQRRGGELRLLWARGAGPVALAGRGALELAAPVVFGAAVGLGLARILLSQYAPASTTDPGTMTAAALAALIVTLLAVGCVAVTVGVRTHRIFQRVSSTRRWARVVRVLPWELVTAGLAAPAWLRLAAGIPSSRGLGFLPTVDPIALMFPLLLVLTIAGIAVRVLRAALAVSHRMRWWSRPAVQLAVRRLAAARDAVAGVLVVGVLAVGTLAVGHGVASAENTSLDAKAGTLVGADTVMQVGVELPLGRRTLPPSLAADTTMVATENTTAGAVLVVDPATFAGNAWLPDDGSVQRILGQLAAAGPGAAIQTGGSPAGVVRADGLIPLHTIGSTATFPGMPNGFGYVVARSAVNDPAGLDSWFLWSHRPLAEIVSELDRANISHLNPATRARALDALPFYTVAWTFGFITALGAVLAVVAAAALLLTVEARRRENAMSAILAVRMGLRPRSLVVSHVVELGALGVFAAAAGAAVGLTGGAVAATHLDPASWLPPGTTTPAPWLFLLSTAGATVVMVSVAGWTAMRSVRTARMGELIRG
jgi:putative ABC transport system permease protein